MLGILRQFEDPHCDEITDQSVLIDALSGPAPSRRADAGAPHLGDPARVRRDIARVKIKCSVRHKTCK